jgi:PAS domain S-box-containing protein
MRPTTVQPTGVERVFGDDEIIVSKTDLRGVITYANEVFLRVSAYDEADVIGKPHNVIRHPDMPRAIFKLLWDRLTDRRELFAYVLNLAGDGQHYWVFAHVTPSVGRDGAVRGYHSNRRTARATALDRIRPLYAELSAAEARQQRPADALAAGSAALEEFLSRAGASYDEFIWSLEPELAGASA